MPDPHSMFLVNPLEARTIIRTIYKHHGIDLSGRTFASLRHRISLLMKENRIANVETLIHRLLDEPDFLPRFIAGTSVGSPDLFRDPELWIMLREKILPDLIPPHNYIEILIPGCVTGDELYSLMILLRESGLDKQVKIRASCENDRILDQLCYGAFSYARFKNSLDNYEVFHPGASLRRWVDNREGIKYKKPELLEQVNWEICGVDRITCTDRTMMVCFRHRMIYMKTDLQYRVLNDLLGQLRQGAVFIIGIKEALAGFGLEAKYEAVSEDLGIYRKRNGI